MINYMDTYIEGRKRIKESLLPYLKQIPLYNIYQTEIISDSILSRTKIILLYFSSFRDLAPKHLELNEKLIELYAKSKEQASVKLEILYVPVDENWEQCLTNFSRHGEWHMLEPNSPEVTKLIYHCYVCVTPTIRVIHRNGSVISYNGMQQILEYGPNAISLWL